jgi:cell division protein FtsW (lipid II flippase)
MPHVSENNRMRNIFIGILLATVVVPADCLLASASEDDVNRRIDRLEIRVGQVASEPRTNTIIQQDHATGITLVLFGVFCALWAQNTNRNAWFWFFMGFCFSVITVLVLLFKNSEDGTNARKVMASGKPHVDPEE